MRNRVVTQFVGGGFMVLLAAVLAGCESFKPGRPWPLGRYNIEISVDESLKNSSVIVDLVGINPSTRPRWEAYDMGKYWKDSSDPLRRDADKVVLNFVSGQTLTKTLPSTDPQWDKWKSKGEIGRASCREREEHEGAG